MARTKRVALVTSHFPPSNVAGVHRVRVWARHLPEFGWDPVVVTTDPRYYKEKLDPDLADLVDPTTAVIRTKAVPMLSPRFVSDVGLRGFYWYLQAVRKLIEDNAIDFLHITIPSNYLSLLGQALYSRHQFPFGIDYQDPWVHPWPGIEERFSKAWLSYRLAEYLEPWAVKNAALITAVAESYYQPVLHRHPYLRDNCVRAAMPVGNSDRDFEILKQKPREPFLFTPADGNFHIVYAGIVWPKAEAIFNRFLEAVAFLKDHHPQSMERIRVHFVGTGKSPDDPLGHNIEPHAYRLGIDRWITEHPHRISFVDVLNHLTHASAILILGSTEPHYTPSKVHQALQAKRPIFAVLHENSPATDVLRKVGVARVVTLTDEHLPETAELASSLMTFVETSCQNKISASVGANYDSGRQSAATLADALDRALALFSRTRR